MTNNLPYDLKNFRARPRAGASMITIYIIGLTLLIALLGWLGQADREHMREMAAQSCAQMRG